MALLKDKELRLLREDLFPDTHREILQLILQGITDRREIAAKLHRPKDTVRIQIYGNTVPREKTSASDLGIFGIVGREVGEDITKMPQLLIRMIEHGIVAVYVRDNKRD